MSKTSKDGNNKPSWKLVTEFSNSDYLCGLTAGDKIRLKKELVVTETGSGKIIRTHPSRSNAVVLKGSSDSPNIVWCRWTETGDVFTWDNEPEFFDWFERIPTGEE